MPTRNPFVPTRPERCIIRRLSRCGVSGRPMLYAHSLGNGNGERSVKRLVRSGIIHETRPTVRDGRRVSGNYRMIPTGNADMTQFRRCFAQWLVAHAHILLTED